MSNVNFPMPLVEAHEAGELVIFVGAGASIPWPSSLPSFVRLVETIRDESNLESEIGSLDGQQLEDVLGRIADRYGVDVHQRIHDLTSIGASRPSPVHQAIARLASASTIRVVTTNYDRHLSTSFAEIHVEIQEYCAPALPVGNSFTGVVYIHGRLGQDPSTLVATDEDFGHAYLTDAWAARFLDRMFPSNPVLFVGYSHKDTIMKYLARGLGGRSAKRYVLTDEPNSDLWVQLGITPIHSTHADLAPALHDWAARASGGLLGHRARVKALVANQDPTPVPETMSYLETIIANKSTVRFFTEHARGVLWLQWAAGRPEFATLFHPVRDVDPSITWELARWLAQNYITDDELSDTALQIIAEAQAAPGPDLLFEISRCLAGQGWPLAERQRRWLLVVTESPNNMHTSSLLGSLLSETSLADDPNTALFLLDYLSEPRIKPRHTYFSGTFEPVGHVHDATLREIWRQVFSPGLEIYAGRFLDIADRHLRRADLQLTIASESDRLRPSHFRTAIAIVEVHGLDGPLGFLADVARECIDHLVAQKDPEGLRRLDAWAASDVSLLQRLAVHGYNSRTDINASEKLDWLHGTGFVDKYELRSEVHHLVAANVGSAESETVERLVEEIVRHVESTK